MLTNAGSLFKTTFLAGLGLLVGLCLATGARADEKKPDEAKPVVIGGVTILPEKKGLEVSGKLVMEQGILDFLAVVTGGREYESVLSLDVKPSVLHASLLAVGAKPGATPSAIDWRARKDKEEGKHSKPLEPGSQLNLTVIWKTPDGQTKEVPAASLLFNRKTKSAETESNSWYFTGGYFGKNIDGKKVYVADVDGAVIAVVSTDPSAVITLNQDAGNPYDSPDQGFVPNKEALPPVGTPITLRIVLAAPAPEPKK